MKWRVKRENGKCREVHRWIVRLQEYFHSYSYPLASSLILGVMMLAVIQELSSGLSLSLARLPDRQTSRESV